MSDLRYSPLIASILEDLEVDHPDRVLILGNDVPDVVAIAGEAREIPNPQDRLPDGGYVFRTYEGLEVLISSSDTETRTPNSGIEARAPAESNWDAPESDPLIQAYGWLQHLWGEARPIAKPAYEIGAAVFFDQSMEVGLVKARRYSGGSWWYDITLPGGRTTVSQASLSEIPESDDPVAWAKSEPSPAARFAATMTLTKLKGQLTDTVFSFRATKTLFRPYQFRPVMRLLETSNLRLLLADEVGLGKTIEAGLIWTELDARQQADRVLIVCPSMLVPKWRAEMRERFGYAVSELRAPDLDELLEKFQRDEFPARFHGICSLQRLRNWRGLKELADFAPHFDLVIVDEAHTMRNAGTMSNALGNLLSDWADALLFLSATPLNLGTGDLYNLLELLVPGEFPSKSVLEKRLEPNAYLNEIAGSIFTPGVTNQHRLQLLTEMTKSSFGEALSARPEYQELETAFSKPSIETSEIPKIRRHLGSLSALSATVVRTRKVEIEEEKAVRSPVPIEVKWTDREHEFYHAFKEWQVERARAMGLPAGFVTQMPLRLASSCLPKARDLVLSYRESLTRDDDIESGEASDFVNDQGDSVAFDLDRPPADVIEAARRVGSTDSKFDAFLPVLRKIIGSGRRVLLFTFSRRALAYLEKRLDGKVRLAVLHGDIDRDERHRVIERFRQCEFDLVLSTRVATEGLDFEFCSAVVNWDLPWNPMEVEQRIGRIDRFGQTEAKLQVVNFHTPGTIESDIVERVLLRIGVFERSIGELEPILLSKISEIKAAVDSFDLTPAERQLRIDEALAALEEQQLLKAEIEEASSYLTSTDDAEIYGWERSIEQSGRYFGQEELVLLLENWAELSGGGRCIRIRGGRMLELVGNHSMARDMEGVRNDGERSGREVDRHTWDLRDGKPIYLCLDQEDARTSGGDLLTANHPLVRAAIRVRGFKQARFAHVRIPSDAAPPGQYLVLLALAKWSGLRSSKEVWTAVVDCASLQPGPPSVGDVLMAAVAEGALTHGEIDDSTIAVRAVETAKRELLRRQAEEEGRRRAENDFLIQTRRTSIEETHRVKIESIKQRIETLRRDNKLDIIRLFDAQLANQEARLRGAVDSLEKAARCSMQVDPAAICLLEVEPVLAGGEVPK